MCGRFTLSTPAERWADLFDVDLAEATTAPRYNIAPSQNVLAVRQAHDGSGREVAPLRWGLVPAWAKDPKIGSRLINARAESLTEKPAFRDAYRDHRCLLVADGFYEWHGKPGTRRPYYYRLADGGVFGIAALWERWTPPAPSPGIGQTAPVETCTIVTTEANGLVRVVHDRMPVILGPRDYQLWLGARDLEQLSGLLRPCPDDWLVSYAVSSHVNDVRHDDLMCIEPTGKGADGTA
ncbi:MAG TPA: SOS response-associated peptidase [Myxococcota bacterium]|nr:SOS response-associated peptidase [Myxococcota bacterium]